MSDAWFTTRSSVRRSDPRWDAIAAYEPPIRRFLAERYPGIPAADREDLLQEILVAMHERVVAAYRPDMGPFRPFLRTAIANKVRDRARRRRSAAGAVAAAGDPGELAAGEADGPPEVAIDEAAADAIDLEAEVVAAVRAFHDRRAHGPAR
ncbi:MAG TPA: sigma factor, partial [Planctomycetota bacterium]|nr:sigma factor [Planctomycetota bacterium]